LRVRCNNDPRAAEGRWRAGREDPTWIGTIRGGYGNPLTRLASDAPVDRVVAQAFADGLAARGLRAPGALRITCSLSPSTGLTRTSTSGGRPRPISARC